jgi:hypothetical protein
MDPGGNPDGRFPAQSGGHRLPPCVGSGMPPSSLGSWHWVLNPPSTLPQSDGNCERPISR